MQAHDYTSRAVSTGSTGVRLDGAALFAGYCRVVPANRTGLRHGEILRWWSGLVESETARVGRIWRVGPSVDGHSAWWPLLGDNWPRLRTQPGPAAFGRLTLLGVPAAVDRRARVVAPATVARDCPRCGPPSTRRWAPI